VARLVPDQGGLPRVIIADDEPTVLDVTRRLARSLGWQSLLADSAQQAALLLREYGADVDCVLLDLHMPGAEGLACLRELRDAAPGVRIVVMTGDQESASLAATGETRPDAVLVKPFNSCELDEALSGRRAEAA